MDSSELPRSEGALGAWAAAQFVAPCCNVPVFFVPNHPMGGQATRDGFGNPVILVDPSMEYRYGQGFFRFMLAHECAHHVQGHLHALAAVGSHGPYALLAVNPQIEADADCWAARRLAMEGDWHALYEAQQAFALGIGPFVQPGYPSGYQRAEVIRRCGGF